MASYVIEGGYSLQGSIRPQGAKNEALQIISAVLLTPEVVTIHNIPNILDVNNLIDLLRHIGVKVRRLNDEGSYTFQADEVNIEYLHSEEFLSRSRALRGSILMAGALLGRFGYAIFPKPGGDKIGRRRLDTHLIGFQELGASCVYDSDKKSYILEAKKLQGKYMLLDEASVTGTANILMAAALAEGTTTIYNAACEPYLQQLSKLLVRMGAQIEGIGSNRLTIQGVKELHGAEHTMLPDMIEIGSFIGMAAMTNSELRITNVSIPDLGIIPQAFRRLGITIE
ncbi:MAG: UDP-N-acetylglucosamine 1-carboxyvinyltransferase, partial [Porphyromonas sp.]|uniref:UDP-N-acetylglucosamine 1-carboxyvinyltransferase n=1 Tax=Porphyromonas sp. TaxID=1924944 RepID=UPI001CB1AABE